jgi:hypothetical protein
MPRFTPITDGMRVAKRLDHHEGGPKLSADPKTRAPRTATAAPPRAAPPRRMSSVPAPCAPLLPACATRAAGQDFGFLRAAPPRAPAPHEPHDLFPPLESEVIRAKSKPPPIPARTIRVAPSPRPKLDATVVAKRSTARR